MKTLKKNPYKNITLQNNWIGMIWSDSANYGDCRQKNWFTVSLTRSIWTSNYKELLDEEYYLTCTKSIYIEVDFWKINIWERQLTRQRLLGIRETSFNGRNTLNERNIRKSTSTFASANTVIELKCHFNGIFFYFDCFW